MARLSKIHRNSINRYLSAIRERAADFCNALSPISGDTEVDELFFGARRVRGKRGRSAPGKTIVFGIFKRNDKAYTDINLWPHLY